MSRVNCAHVEIGLGARFVPKLICLSAGNLCGIYQRGSDTCHATEDRSVMWSTVCIQSIWRAGSISQCVRYPGNIVLLHKLTNRIQTGLIVIVRLNNIKMAEKYTQYGQYPSYPLSSVYAVTSLIIMTKREDKSITIKTHNSTLWGELRKKLCAHGSPVENLFGNNAI